MGLATVTINTQKTKWKFGGTTALSWPNWASSVQCTTLELTYNCVAITHTYFQAFKGAYARSTCGFHK